ncbi:MAG: serine/threonine-protein kinase [Isosphaeraceae bacterium]|nr:serine/threonine-protein kinase [Isosphaeraceae bacterium]
MATLPETEPAPDRDPIDLLAEEYAARYRRGEDPAVEEYAARHPELADEIRRLLPAVAFLERGKRGGTELDVTAVLGSGEIPALTDPLVGHYGENRVVRELGRGGMGIVYEAVQEPLGRRVAVKVLPRHAMGDARNRQRFFREAKAVARLDHPHIVPIHALGEQDGLPYYVMPLIDGCGLDRLLADPKAVTPAEPAPRALWVARLGLQAAEALAYAHGQGVLHRDIKPANLLLDASGTLWLADFGLAKFADDLSLTAVGDLPGTLRYLAPECLHVEADARSDIYSLGLTLYELLVGRPAFGEVDRVRLLRQVESQPIPAPASLMSGLPRDLDTILLKATAREPAARYATAGDLADDFQRFLDGRPIRARRTSVPERLVRWCRRNPVVAALGGTSVVLALIAIRFFVFYMEAPPPDPLHPGQQPAVPRPDDRPPPRGFFHRLLGGPPPDARQGPHPHPPHLRPPPPPRW